MVNERISDSRLLLWTVPVLAQQDPATVQIQTQKLTGNVFMLMGDGGNIGLSTGADGSVVVDTEYAPLNAKILAAVRGAGSSDVKYVINTHWHGDHTGGNEPLGKAGALIIAHDNVLARMSTEQFMAAFNQKVPPAPAAARPVVTFPTRTTFPLERRRRPNRASRTRTRTATRSCTSRTQTSFTRATRT